MISKTISHYVILNQLGVGGMGEVYLAEDTKLNRKVALKVIKGASEADELAKKRLIREAHAAARLDHPNICAIHEVGEWNGESFIVMQYVEGETLADRIVRKPFDLAESIEVAVQVADALSEAHSQGIVHRDIKPQNIMLTLRGQAKVMDFGLARLTPQESGIDSGVDTRSTLTEPGVLVGTVPYLSPEQVRGETADGRSDIFSLGAMLYKMITGRHPFAGDNDGATIAAILTLDPPPLARYATKVPNELERIQHKCLEKDRERRYQSARELLVDLRSLQRGLDASTVRIETESSTNESKARRLIHVAFGVATLALISAGLLFFASDNKNSGKAISSVAVLPFVNVGDPNTEYLSDGLTDGLINNLSQLPNLKVIARSSVFRFKGREADAQAVGRDLSVRAVLTGKVAQLGDTISITAELADARDNSHIWGAQYTRSNSDIFLLQGEISKDISEKLRITLSGEERKRLTKPETDNPEAFQLYLKGRFYLNKRTQEAFEKATAYFNEAIAKDPQYALGYAGLADCYALLCNYDILAPREGFPKAKAAALKALELDDRLAEAHTSLGIVKMQYDWDWTGAEEELNRAIELKPSYATARQWYVYYLSVMQRFDESIEVSKQAQEIDPLSLNINANLARAFYYSRKYDQAIEQCYKALEMDKSFGVFYVILGLAYEQKGMHKEAIEAFQKTLTVFDRIPWIASLGHAYATSGRRAEALKIIAELKQQSKRRYVSPFHIGAIYQGLGEKDLAFEWFEMAYQDRSNLLPGLRMEPEFDNIRKDPRFRDLLRRIGLAG